jgi:hypothetical protein
MLVRRSWGTVGRLMRLNREPCGRRSSSLCAQIQTLFFCLTLASGDLFDAFSARIVHVLVRISKYTSLYGMRERLVSRSGSYHVLYFSMYYLCNQLNQGHQRDRPRIQSSIDLTLQQKIVTIQTPPDASLDSAHQFWCSL